MINYNCHTNKSDEWLTPPALLKVLGKFNTDPCVAIKMPWKTATIMYSIKDNGLLKKWRGRVFLNPPYSNVKPFIEKMIEHNNGIALLSAKSIDSKWGQLVLKHSACVLFLSGRLSFYTLNGEDSKGKWLSNMLVAFGKENILILRNAMKEFPGIIMRKI